MSVGLLLFHNDSVFAFQDALDHTTAWLNRAVQEAATAPSNKGPGKTSTSPSPAILSPSAVLDQAYLSLLRWDPDCQLYPEVRQEQLEEGWGPVFRLLF